MFLGQPISSKTCAVLDFLSNTITLCSNIPVYATEHIALEPYSEAIVQGKLHNQIPNATTGLCTVFPAVNA